MSRMAAEMVELRELVKSLASSPPPAGAPVQGNAMEPAPSTEAPLTQSGLMEALRQFATGAQAFAHFINEAGTSSC